MRSFTLVSGTVADQNAHDFGRTYSIDASIEKCKHNKAGPFRDDDAYWEPLDNRCTKGGVQEGLGTLMTSGTKWGDYIVLKKLLIETRASGLSVAPTTLLIYGFRDEQLSFALIGSVSRHGNQLGTFIDNSTAYNSYLVQFMRMADPESVQIQRNL